MQNSLLDAVFITAGGAVGADACGACTFMILASFVDVIIQTLSNLIFEHAEAKQHRPVPWIKTNSQGSSNMHAYKRGSKGGFHASMQAGAAGAENAVQQCCMMHAAWINNGASASSSLTLPCMYVELACILS